MSGAKETRKTFLWLSEILEDPEILKPPKAIVPKIVWEKRITLLAAREKGGKSTLAGAAAAAISAGRPFLGEDTVPGNVLVVALEEHPQEFVQRFVRFGADPERIAVVGNQENLVEAIEKAAEEIQPSLIIWDTLSAFADAISPSPIDPGDGPAWTRVMSIIVDITRKHGASLILHHSRKSDGKYRDSTAIGANVDFIIEMFGDGTEPRTLKGKGRFSMSDTKFRMDRDDFVLVESEKEFHDRILKFVRANPRCSLRSLREAVGGRTDEVAKARDKLLSSGLLANVGTAVNHAYMATK